MRKKVFLSHNSADKSFTRKLANDLENQGISVWIDEQDIYPGEELLLKIRNAIISSDYVVVVLSPRSVESRWVMEEVEHAIRLEREEERTIVIPIIIEECKLPEIISGKHRIKFTNDFDYKNSLKSLVRGLGIVFNNSAFSEKNSNETLEKFLDKAMLKRLPFLTKPFHRPHQYMGMTISQAEKAVSEIANEAGNIIVESDDCRMLLEAEGNFISYIDIEIKCTAPHYLNQEFDSEAILGSMSIGLSEVELIRKNTHCHVYYDHKKKLKVSAACLYEGSPLSVGFSSKYYGM